MGSYPTHGSSLARSTFTRGTESLVLETCGNTEIVLVYRDTPPQIFRFDDQTAQVLFQSNLEQRLVWTGWTLTTFETGNKFPRLVRVSDS
jgi:hypothetical protein